MGKPLKTIIQGLQRSHLHRFPSKPSSPDAPFPQNPTHKHHLHPQIRSPKVALRNSSPGAFPSGCSNPRNLSSQIDSHESISKNARSIFSPKPHLCLPSIENPLSNSLSGVFPPGFLKSRHSSSEIYLIRSYFHKPTSQNAHYTYIFSPRYLKSEIPSKPSSFGIGTRAFSSKSLGLGNANGNQFLNGFSTFGGPGSGKIDEDFAKSIIDRPFSAIRSTFSRYRDAVGLQVEAFLERNSWALVGAGGVGVCILLWRIMFGIADFIGISQGTAKYGSLAMAAATVAFAGLYIRSRFTINPDRIYRMALRKLNMSAGVLEVMGTPLKGTELRAYVMSGGVRLKNFKLRVGKRCFLIFPIRGSQRNGLVSVEVKKKKGQYDVKLLAVDIPMTNGPDHRLFVIGDEEKYSIGDGLIAELRDPIVKAMAAKKEFDDLDQKEEEEDAERELQEAERKHREEIEKIERVST
ncbi:hypothetical protein AAC387_Pa01g0875 [Persea americana]